MFFKGMQSYNAVVLRILKNLSITKVKRYASEIQNMYIHEILV